MLYMRTTTTNTYILCCRCFLPLRWCWYCCFAAHATRHWCQLAFAGSRYFWWLIYGNYFPLNVLLAFSHQLHCADYTHERMHTYICAYVSKYLHVYDTCRQPYISPTVMFAYWLKLRLKLRLKLKQFSSVGSGFGQDLCVCLYICFGSLPFRLPK